MPRRPFLLVFCLAFFLSSASLLCTQAQDDDSAVHVVVNMVQLNVAVTNKKGDYVTGLRPEDFVIAEDGINEKLATFAEGDAPARDLQSYNANAQPGDQTEQKSASAPTLQSLVAGANVFVLFDSSNYMYRDFVFAEDAIAEFVRSLETADKIAFYSYSRDLLRSATLTSDRTQVLRGVRSTVAGDSAALYNALLLTVKDAARCTGRKIVVVFSNGPDNSSVVPPEDVAEIAQSAGVSVYIISTQEAKVEPISTAVFERMTADTGGMAYFAKNWRDERRAFASIQNDMAHLYSLSYYPKPNQNTGWRAIKVTLAGEKARKYKVRTRNGYRLQPRHFSGHATSAMEINP
ncbi:MAG TPA: VWA domain-containing protein [Candidatus Aquilonibacter sp.]|nr:VWA domain-containing protein [Candidatus Aquilonibacter sp.]